MPKKFKTSLNLFYLAPVMHVPLTKLYYGCHILFFIARYSSAAIIPSGFICIALLIRAEFYLIRHQSFSSS